MHLILRRNKSIIWLLIYHADTDTGLESMIACTLLLSNIPEVRISRGVPISSYDFPAHGDSNWAARADGKTRRRWRIGGL